MSDAAHTPDSKAKAQARAYAALGVLAFWGVVAGLTLGADYAMVDALLLAALLAAVPGLAMAQVPPISSEPAATSVTAATTTATRPRQLRVALNASANNAAPTSSTASLLAETTTAAKQIAPATAAMTKPGS